MLILNDLHELCDRYVPAASRHPYSWHQPSETYWYAHELGHLLTVERAWIGLEEFGLGDDGQCSDGERRCRELAAMSVSRRLLRRCGRMDLFQDELENTDADTIYHNGGWRVRAILCKHRCLRLPSTRDGLERKIKEKLR